MLITSLRWIFLLLILTSCDDAEQIKTRKYWDNFSLEKANYQNHSYIFGYSSKGIALVHDPDCPCQKKGE